MGQRFVPHSGYRQRQAKLFNYVKTQGKIEPCRKLYKMKPETKKYKKYWYRPKVWG